jgi:hypothetical protein
MRLEFGSIGDHLALGRGPRRQPAAEWSTAEVGRRVGAADRLDPTGHTRLAGLAAPVEHQRRARVGRQVVRLGAFEVGVEDEATLVEAAQHDHARRWRPVRRGGRQRHRVGVLGIGLARVGQPLLELPQRVRVEIIHA